MEILASLHDMAMRDNTHFRGSLRIDGMWNPREADPEYARSACGVTIGCTGNHCVADYAYDPDHGWVLWAN